MIVMPEEFVNLHKRVPALQIDLKYAGSDNIVGRPIAGYAPDAACWLTAAAAESIAKMLQALRTPTVCKMLNLTDPTLLVWDAYRPQMAVDDFYQWSQSACEKTKAAFYPNVDKSVLFKDGYFAQKSGHSRGSTIDLTIVDGVNGPIDMGTPFDFMDELSHTQNPRVSARAFQHRQFLKTLMADYGWLGVHLEWWHFTFEAEPFPDTYFNFPVTNHELISNA